jgi:hypothetical protein
VRDGGDRMESNTMMTELLAITPNGPRRDGTRHKAPTMRAFQKPPCAIAALRAIIGFQYAQQRSARKREYTGFSLRIRKFCCCEPRTSQSD